MFTEKLPVFLDYDCIMVMISSHGTESSLICSDGEVIFLSEIINIYNGTGSKIPIQVPKLFFIQAFCGDECDSGNAASQNISSGVPADCANTTTFPSDANVLVVHSTMENNGCSWFIDCLLKIFKNYSKSEDLLTMLTRVNREMYFYSEDDKKKRTSSQISQLTYKIFLTKNL